MCSHFISLQIVDNNYVCFHMHSLTNICLGIYSITTNMIVLLLHHLHIHGMGGLESLVQADVGAGGKEGGIIIYRSPNSALSTSHTFIPGPLQKFFSKTCTHTSYRYNFMLAIMNLLYTDYYRSRDY